MTCCLAICSSVSVNRGVRFTVDLLVDLDLQLYNCTGTCLFFYVWWLNHGDLKVDLLRDGLGLQPVSEVMSRFATSRLVQLVDLQPDELVANRLFWH